MKKLWDGNGQWTPRGQDVSAAFGKLLVRFIRSNTRTAEDSIDLEVLMVRGVVLHSSLRRLKLMTLKKR